MTQLAALDRRIDALIDEIESLRADNATLREENDRLAARTAAIEARVPALSASLPARHPGNREAPQAPVLPRRRLLAGVGAGALAASAGLALARPRRAEALLLAGLPLVQYMSFGDIYTLTPVDSSVRWDRTAPVGAALGSTHEILSLFSTSDQKNSFAWPLFVELRGTNHPDATIPTSQSTGVQVRAFNRGTNEAWLVGVHSEMHHGANFDGTTGADAAPAVANRGTTIGYNLETVRKSPLGRVVGMNLHNNPVSAYDGTEALLIKGSGPGKGWTQGIRFEATGAPGTDAISVEEDFTNGVALRSPNGATGVLLANGRSTPAAGSRGVWLQGRYETGIEMGPNPLVMNAGERLYLEQTKQVWIRYNSTLSRIEFGNGGAVLAHLSTSSTDHAL